VNADAGETRPGAPRAAASVLTAGSGHSCVIVESGAGPGGDVRCWGANQFGQLGLGETLFRGDQANELASTPSIQLGAKAISISAGRFHTCAILVGGTVKCWGRNEAGQLGLGNIANRGDGPNEMAGNLPAVDLGTGRTATMIAAGGAFTCALLDNATVKCWGANESGQLGQGDTSRRGDGAAEMGNSLAPVALGDGVAPVSIAAGGEHVCALVVEFTVRSLRCWGENGDGQLGLGSTADRGDGPSEVASAVPAPAGVSNVSAMALGRAHTCVLTGATVSCWGANNAGQLGRGVIGQARGDQVGEIAEAGGTTMTVGSAVDGLTAMADGTCILRPGFAQCWGENDRGQLGRENQLDLGGPTFDLVAAPYTMLATTMSAITGGDAHVCAVLANRDVKCLGANESGQLGLGDTFDRGDSSGSTVNLPVVAMVAPFTASAVAVGNGQACALVDGGQLKCWGRNLFGQRGYGAVDAVVGQLPGEIANAPFVNLGAGRTAEQVSAGSDFTCALLDNGTVKCWGRNNSGQLGLGDTVNRSTAAQMNTLPRRRPRHWTNCRVDLGRIRARLRDPRHRATQVLGFELRRHARYPEFRQLGRRAQRDGQQPAHGRPRHWTYRDAGVGGEMEHVRQAR
jgi:alpha-tubulin suppressor-like RCC1 family protein